MPVCHLTSPQSLPVRDVLHEINFASNHLFPFLVNSGSPPLHTRSSTCRSTTRGTSTMLYSRLIRRSPPLKQARAPTSLTASRTNAGLIRRHPTTSPWTTAMVSWAWRCVSSCLATFKMKPGKLHLYYKWNGFD